MDGGRLYSCGGGSIKVSKAIVDRYRNNRELSTADEGLVICILMNNKGARDEVDPNLKSFLKGKTIRCILSLREFYRKNNQRLLICFISGLIGERTRGDQERVGKLDSYIQKFFQNKMNAFL